MEGVEVWREEGRELMLREGDVWKEGGVWTDGGVEGVDM